MGKFDISLSRTSEKQVFNEKGQFPVNFIESRSLQTSFSNTLSVCSQEDGGSHDDDDDDDN